MLLHRPDVIVLDLGLPDGNGLDLLPRIRKQRPELRVVVMSAQNTFMTAIRASERGAYEYLPKPFDLDQLVRIVGQALAGSEAKRPRKAKPGPRAPRPPSPPRKSRSSAVPPRCRMSTACWQG